jgi:hypothetical protein
LAKHRRSKLDKIVPVVGIGFVLSLYSGVLTRAESRQTLVQDFVRTSIQKHVLGKAGQFTAGTDSRLCRKSAAIAVAVSITPELSEYTANGRNHHTNRTMAQKKGCANSMARGKSAVGGTAMTGELKGSHHDRLRLRWKKAEDLLQQLDELDFKDAVQAIRKQLAREKKWVDKKTNEQSKKVVVVRKPQPKSKDGKKGTKDDESETDESSSSSSDESAASNDEESSSSAEEESEEEASSSSDEEEEDESSSDDEADEEESEKEEEIPQTHQKTIAPPQQRGSRAPFKRVVSFSDRAHDVHVLSPKTESKDKLFYTRQDIERFRMEDRMRKTEEAQANLEALIADAKITMMGLSASS